jgi:hypothetical protein
MLSSGARGACSTLEDCSYVKGSNTYFRAFRISHPGRFINKKWARQCVIDLAFLRLFCTILLASLWTCLFLLLSTETKQLFHSDHANQRMKCGPSWTPDRCFSKHSQRASHEDDLLKSAQGRC